jgi:hypothetical protein
MLIFYLVLYTHISLNKFIYLYLYRLLQENEKMAAYISSLEAKSIEELQRAKELGSELKEYAHRDGG